MRTRKATAAAVRPGLPMRRKVMTRVRWRWGTLDRFIKVAGKRGPASTAPHSGLLRFRLVGDVRRAYFEHVEHQPLSVLRKIHPHPAPFRNVFLEQPHRERVLEPALDRPFERPRAECGIVALARQELLGRFAHFELEPKLISDLVDTAKLEVDDLLDQRLGERPENDHVVYPVQKLGPEMLLEVTQHIRLELHALILYLERTGVLQDHVTSDVRRHDDDRIPEIDGATMGVGQATVVENLEQNVEDVLVRFLDLVEEHPPSAGGGAPLR